MRVLALVLLGNPLAVVIVVLLEILMKKDILLLKQSTEYFYTVTKGQRIDIIVVELMEDNTNLLTMYPTVPVK